MISMKKHEEVYSQLVTKSFAKYLVRYIDELSREKHPAMLHDVQRIISSCIFLA